MNACCFNSTAAFLIALVIQCDKDNPQNTERRKETFSDPFIHESTRREDSMIERGEDSTEDKTHSDEKHSRPNLVDRRQSRSAIKNQRKTN